jgi:nitrogen regulatory protein PII
MVVGVVGIAACAPTDPSGTNGGGIEVPSGGDNEKPQTVKITLRVSAASAVDSKNPTAQALASNNQITPEGLMYDASMWVPVGSTAHEVLDSTVLEVVTSDAASSAAIESINGLANGDGGSGTTWKVQVNDTELAQSVDTYIVQHDDVITITLS